MRPPVYENAARDPSLDRHQKGGRNGDCPEALLTWPSNLSHLESSVRINKTARGDTPQETVRHASKIGEMAQSQDRGDASADTILNSRRCQSAVDDYVIHPVF